MQTSNPGPDAQGDRDDSRSCNNDAALTYVRPQPPAAETAELLQTELNYILDNIRCGVRIINKDHVIHRVNQAFCDMSGIRAEDAVGRKCWEIFSGPRCHTPQCRLQLILQGESAVTSEIDQRGTGGINLRCVVTAIPFKADNGDLFGAIEIYRDVTDEKNAQQKIAESERFNEVILNLETNAGEAVLILQDIDGKEDVQLSVTDKWPLITGYSLDELIGKSLFDLIRDEDRGAAVDRHARRMTGESLPGPFDSIFVRKDGTEVPVELTALVTTLGNQRTTVAHVRDISVRRRAEKNLEDHRIHLEEVVNDRTAQLREQVAIANEAEVKIREFFERESRLRRQIEGQMQERAEFMRILAHELRTPLTALLTASDLLTETVQEETSKNLARQVNKGAWDLNKRVTELFDLARGEVGMLNLRCQEVFPGKILEGTLAYFSAAAKKKHVVLKADWPTRLPTVWGDHQRITEVLNNLMDNALKYTGEDGTITLKARRKNEHLLVEVEDTGCGIPEDKQNILFKAHRRLNYNNQERGGMGLGLALSKTLVELHGGKIWVESHGSGSKFSFTLPLKRGNTRTEDTVNML